MVFEAQRPTMWRHMNLRETTVDGIQRLIDSYANGGWELVSVTAFEGELVAFIRQGVG